ncbi:GTP-binding protein [Streptomyces sp. NPDC049954]|uniref:CobW family GTP-binding protein n=1 Tax=Streptomyces sp. NPDC049954 TaxID=3155779 RepID=UPI003427643C
MSPTPLTVVGGYLGSGKTTRINALLESWRGDPIGIVVNDFGTINIDASLIRSRGTDVMELHNGCVCCSLSDGMTTVMQRLAAMPDLGHAIVEVSGVGDPAGVARWGSFPGFTPGGIAVCADAETIQERARDRWVSDTVLAQLHSADVVLLTKSDLVSETQRDTVKAWIHDVTGGTPVTTAPDLFSGLAARTTVSQEGQGPHGRHHTPTAHDPVVHRTWSVATSAPIDLDRLRIFLAQLPDAVVRGKGVLRTRQAPDRRTAIHLVGHRVEITDDGAWCASDPDLGIVLVATRAPGVPAGIAQEMLRALNVDPHTAVVQQA